MRNVDFPQFFKSFHATASFLLVFLHFSLIYDDDWSTQLKMYDLILLLRTQHSSYKCCDEKWWQKPKFFIFIIRNQSFILYKEKIFIFHVGEASKCENCLIAEIFQLIIIHTFHRWLKRYAICFINFINFKAIVLKIKTSEINTSCMAFDTVDLST